MSGTTEAAATRDSQKGTLSTKYLTFALADESYGLDVLKVREIIRFTSITAVPEMPAYVSGVINLRGRIIPVMDLRLRFNLPAVQPTEQTCIVVVLVHRAGQAPVQMGLIVDSVEEVINISADDIEETPDFGQNLSTESIVGMAKVKGSVKTLLDIDKVLAGTTVPRL